MICKKVLLDILQKNCSINVRKIPENTSQKVHFLIKLKDGGLQFYQTCTSLRLFFRNFARVISKFLQFMKGWNNTYLAENVLVATFSGPKSVGILIVCELFY